MQGRRLPDATGLKGTRFAPGDYQKVTFAADDSYMQGTLWYCMTPDGSLGNLGDHTITEHEDGTITVSPSILISEGSKQLWHGYLEHGVWREC